MEDSRKFVIKTREQAQEFSDWLGLLVIPDSGVQIEVQPFVKHRTVSQNRLFWMWMNYLVQINRAKDDTITANDWHDYFVAKFLGWTESSTIGLTVLPPRLKKTRDLNRKQMTEFMQQIEAFCAERNVYLPVPSNAAYLDYITKGDGNGDCHENIT